ncbi:hypothetical protein [Pseudomonas sp. SG20052]|uniref:hypothetical protein n=1 Tax=Pseudomonas sp. SG20052 TaxID=3074147 RepID=UPI00287FD2E7|nr:hypothetical protein [Pseudomonas sp. SG20052]WNF55373.1 hypothetical protein RHP74_29545 [Pseudomonas sp. SG20052]
MKDNSTFREAEPGWANACVGNNGNPSYVEYSRGFSQAANLLIELVLNDSGMNLSVDDLIYPVCFNMRHSVELRLKGAIKELSLIAELKNIRIEFDDAGSHDIGSIWEYFKSISERLDDRFARINSVIDPTVLDIASVDATGQTFRYPISNTSQKHLTEVASINFRVLFKKFAELEENLDKLHQLTQFLCEEYQQGTFTGKLSRPQIYSVAKRLPPKSTWAGGALEPVKHAIRSEYGITSNDFGKVLGKIKSHYYLSSLIDDPLPLLGISEETILEFFDHWVRRHPIFRERHKIEIVNFSVLHKKSLVEDIIFSEKVWGEIYNQMRASLTPGVVAGLRSLFYFARENIFVERYQLIYEYELRASAAASDLEDELKHIFNKTNGLKNVLISLFALGRVDFAEALISKYQLSYHFIDSARSRTLFAYPDCSGY